MAVALGRSEDEEVAPGLHNLADSLSGQSGLIFTNEKEKDFVG